MGIECEGDLQHACLIVKDTEVESMNKCKTPSISERSKVLEREQEQMSYEGQTKFTSVEARINFLASDRTDLQFVSKDLCRRTASPEKGDWDKARRIARYLLRCPRAAQIFKFEGETQGFADSDRAGERPGMKSTSGGLLMWESPLLRSWSSTQNTTSLSSAEAELSAMSKCAPTALHLGCTGEDLGVVLKPVTRGDQACPHTVLVDPGGGGERAKKDPEGAGWRQPRRCAHQVPLGGRARTLHELDELLVQG